MLILGDESHFRGKLPWVTFSLIAINILGYSAQCLLGPSLTLGFSLIPKEITTLTDLTHPERVNAKVPARISYDRGVRRVHYREVTVTVPQAPGPFPIVLTLFTSMFMHGNLLHLVGNMWFLVVFGRNVECALDHGRFLLFYVVCGVIGGLLYTFSDASSVIPCLGASGAIAGVMGGYLAIYPFNPIALWFGFYIGVIKLPAFIVVGAWFFLQYVAAFEALEVGGATLGGTAYWDHIGGFLSGATIVWAMIASLKWQQLNPPAQEDELEPALSQEADRKPAPDPFASCLPEN